MVAGFVNALFLIFIGFFIFSEAIEVCNGRERGWKEGKGGRGWKEQICIGCFISIIHYRELLNLLKLNMRD